MSITSITQSNIQSAVDLWINDNATALTTYGHIKDWDTSNVTDMHDLFRMKNTFNDDISGWDTSNVTTMRRMFQGAVLFDQNISGWDTSKVENMYFMFYQAEVFNQEIGSWDVSSVTDMRYMFRWAHAFNKEIRTWKSTIQTPQLSNMFDGATAFINNTTWNTATGFNNVTPDITFWTSYTDTNTSAPDTNTGSSDTNTGSSGLVGELQAIDNNNTAATLTNPSDNKKRLAIALAKLV